MSDASTALESSAESIQLAWRGISCANEDQVRANAEKVASAIDSTQVLDPAIALDVIWEGNEFHKYYLPDYVQARSTTISFPEKLMLLLVHIERVFVKSGRNENLAPIAWTLEGRAVIIHGVEREEFVEKWLPLFFPRGKFESFTRKLYRWGFRQVCVPRESMETDKERTLIFASPCFQKDRVCLMAYMRSVTARNSRRVQQLGKKTAPTGKKDTIKKPLVKKTAPSAEEDSAKKSLAEESPKMSVSETPRVSGTFVAHAPPASTYHAHATESSHSVRSGAPRIFVIPPGMTLVDVSGQQLAPGFHPVQTRMTLLPVGHQPNHASAPIFVPTNAGIPQQRVPLITNSATGIAQSTPASQQPAVMYFPSTVPSRNYYSAPAPRWGEEPEQSDFYGGYRRYSG